MSAHFGVLSLLHCPETHPVRMRTASNTKVLVVVYYSLKPALKPDSHSFISSTKCWIRVNTMKNIISLFFDFNVQAVILQAFAAFSCVPTVQLNNLPLSQKPHWQLNRRALGDVGSESILRKRERPHFSRPTFVGTLHDKRHCWYLLLQC